MALQAVGIDPNKYKCVDNRRVHSTTGVGDYFDDQEWSEFVEYTVAPVIGGAVVGGALGAAAGVYVGATAGSCAGPVGSGTGAAIGGGVGWVKGAFIGAAAGFAGGSIYSLYANYSEYHAWLKDLKEDKKAIEKEALQEFYELHVDHPQLQEFIDPIHLTLIFDPVRAPSGRLYDRSTLKGLSDAHNGVIPDPFDRKAESFTMDQVENATDMLAKMKKVYSTLLQEELGTNITPKVREGLQALINDLARQVTNYVARETRILTAQFQSGQITPTQFQTSMTKILRVMD